MSLLPFISDKKNSWLCVGDIFIVQFELHVEPDASLLHKLRFTQMRLV
jgi:hypothetical protein